MDEQPGYKLLKKEIKTSIKEEKKIKRKETLPNKRHFNVSLYLI